MIDWRNDVAGFVRCRGCGHAAHGEGACQWAGFNPETETEFRCECEMQRRAAGCKCDLEEGDSDCPVHVCDPPAPLAGLGKEGVP